MRRGTLLIIAGILMLSASCKKVNFEAAEWMESECWSYGLYDSLPPLDSATFSVLYNGFNYHQMFAIEDEADFLTFRQFDQHQVIENLILPESKLAQVDLTMYNIYVLRVRSLTQDCFEISKSNIKINEKEKEIYFDFKVDFGVGSSGMTTLQKYIYFIIPKDKSDYYFHGDLKYNEMGLGEAKNRSYHHELM